MVKSDTYEMISYHYDKMLDITEDMVQRIYAAGCKGGACCILSIILDEILNFKGEIKTGLQFLLDDYGCIQPMGDIRSETQGNCQFHVWYEWNGKVIDPGRGLDITGLSEHLPRETLLQLFGMIEIYPEGSLPPGFDADELQVGQTEEEISYQKKMIDDYKRDRIKFWRERCKPGAKLYREIKIFNEVMKTLKKKYKNYRKSLSAV
tara:strand:+ start:77 stop:694 length:618 start_codon:yes stop_codon:yes gene_type:complete